MLPREREQTHPRRPEAGLEARYQHAHGLHLGGEDRVARVRAEDGLHRLERKSDLPVPIDVDASRLLGRTRYVDRDHDLVARSFALAKADPALDGCAILVVDHRRTRLRRRDLDTDPLPIPLSIRAAPGAFLPPEPESDSPGCRRDPTVRIDAAHPDLVEALRIGFELATVCDDPRMVGV